jgi:prolipoprotein diacylglyceryltransferase
MYGAPSALPWAVAIDPSRRANGYESFATFQPVFLYESLWDLLVAAGVAYAIRRFLLTGDRAFALYAALYAVGRLAAETVRIDYSPRVLGARVTELAMLAVIVVAVGYLCVSRARRRRPAPGGVASGAAVTGLAAGPAAAETARPA